MNLSHYATALHASKTLKLGNINHQLTLILLREAHQLPMNAIAAKLEIGTAAMTGVADALVKQGSVRREFGTADRRLVFLSITTAGREQLERLEQLAAATTRHTAAA